MRQALHKTLKNQVVLPALVMCTPALETQEKGAEILLTERNVKARPPGEMKSQG